MKIYSSPFKSIKRAWKVLESIFLSRNWWWSMVIDWFMFHLSKSKFINLYRKNIEHNFIPSRAELCNLSFHAAVEPPLKGDFFLFPWCLQHYCTSTLHKFPYQLDIIVEECSLIAWLQLWYINGKSFFLQSQNIYCINICDSP